MANCQLIIESHYYMDCCCSLFSLKVSKLLKTVNSPNLFSPLGRTIHIGTDLLFVQASIYQMNRLHLLSETVNLFGLFSWLTRLDQFQFPFESNVKNKTIKRKRSNKWPSAVDFQCSQPHIDLKYHQFNTNQHQIRSHMRCVPQW